jgi:rhamnogalacturonyl hydrolase YesR
MTLLEARVVELGRTFFRVRPPRSLAWSWRTAILLFGAVELGAATGDAELIDAVAEFFSNPAHARVRIRRSDAAACALPAIALYEATGERAGLALAERAAEYLYHAPTSPRGAVYHLGTELWARPLPDSVWADSLMMVGVTLARLSRAWSDSALRDRALATAFAFARELMDERTGLYKHARIPSLDAIFPEGDAYWLRGNGWILASAAHIASALALSPRERAAFSEIVAPPAEALARAMYSDGSLPNVVVARDRRERRARDAHRSARPIESSGTALVAAGMLGLARQGLIRSELARDGARAAHAAASCVARDSRGRLVLRNTKGPTNAGPSWSYALVPESVNADYGVGGMMLAAAEVRASRRSGSAILRGDERALTSSAAE